MKTTTLSMNVRKYIVAILMGVTMFFGAFAILPAHKAEAADLDAMRAQIQQLIQIVSELQEQLLIKQRKQYEDLHQTTTNIIHGNSYVEATTKVTLYKQPNGKSSVSKQSKGDGGEVIDGPRLIDGEVWWKIAFDEEDEGWVMEKYLERIPSIKISQDQDGDGIKETSVRILGDYRAERVILFPTEKGVSAIYVQEGMDMIGTNEDDYVSGQVSRTVDGPATVVQSDPYDLSGPAIKGQHKSVPIAWVAENVPMNAKVEVQVEAVRLVDSPLSGGTWEGKTLVGDSAGRYFWNIEGVGTIGAGDYRSQVRLKECVGDDCIVVAQSPYRYFSIKNP